LVVVPGIEPGIHAQAQRPLATRRWPGQARSSARLSGLALVPFERQLKGVEIGRRLGFEQAIDAAAMQQIGANQSGKDERAVDGMLCRLGEAERQKGDQRDRDLNAHGIFAGAEKAANFEGLLDPTED
jgi:hypothetical protein